MSAIVDLRSDTVTRPSAAMRAAMMAAEVGDDVYGEDPTVNRLESETAARLGFEAAIFAPTGTQSNLLAIMGHCERGDEYIVGQNAHTYKFEAGGAAVLGSVQPQPLDFDDDGTLDLDRVARAIKPDDIHFAKTRLLCMENTHLGKALPLDYLTRAAAFCRERKLAFHLDGARIFNAAVALKVDVRDIGSHFDSVSVCLSKGLGAPIGSLLCGSRGLIGKARRWRKMLGGGWRQAGVLAAAGLYALEHNVARLADDHANAARLAEGLSRLPAVQIVYVATNMLMARTDKTVDQNALVAFLKTRDVILRPGDPIRMVTHLDIDADGVERVIAAFAEFLAMSGKERQAFRGAAAALY